MPCCHLGTIVDDDDDVDDDDVDDDDDVYVDVVDRMVL